MRQIIFILSIFFIFLFVLNHFTVDLHKKTTPASFVEGEVLFFSSHKNPLQRINDFKKSRLGTKLGEIEYSRIASGFKVSEKDIQTFIRAGEKIEEWSQDPFVRELLRKEISLIVFPAKKTGVKKTSNTFLDNTLVVARTGYFANIKRFLDRSPKIADQYRQSEYGSHVIIRFLIKGDQEVAVSKVKDLILVSFNERLLRRCLDVYDREPEIKNSPQIVKEFINNSGKTSSSAYLNLDIFRKMLSEFAVDNSATTGDGISHIVELLNGLNSIEWIETIKGRSISQKMSLKYDLSEIHPPFRELFSAKTVATESYERLSKDTVWYYWTNIFRIKEIFKNFGGDFEHQNHPPHIFSIENFARINRIPVENLLSLFQSEFLIAIKKRNENTFVPVPHILTALKLTNQTETRKVLKKILDYYDVPVTTRKSGGITINYWGGVLSNKDMQPTYAIFDDYLVMASNAAQIKEFKILPENDIGITGSKRFREVSRGFTEKNNSLNYIDLREVIKITRDLLNWGGAMVAILGNNAVNKTKLIIDDFFDPVLDGMSMYSTMGITSRIVDEELVIQSITLLE